MIPSVDTYLKTELERHLKYLLSRSYIIEGILQDMKDTAIKDFVDYYSAEEGRTIPIFFEYPDVKVERMGAIYIYQREGIETGKSLGGLQGRGDQMSTNARQAVFTAVKEDDKLVFHFLDKEGKPFKIGKIDHIDGILFASSDNFDYDEDKAWFNYHGNEHLEGSTKLFLYYLKTDKSFNLVKGFTAEEIYAIESISTNFNMVRCIDSIVKAALIMMRSTLTENNSYQLQKMRFGQLEEAPLDDIDGKSKPEMVFGRVIHVQYTTHYDIDEAVLKYIDEVAVQMRMGGFYDEQG